MLLSIRRRPEQEEQAAVLLIHKVLLSDTPLINNHIAVHPGAPWQSFIFHPEPWDSLGILPESRLSVWVTAESAWEPQTGKKEIPVKVKGQGETESSEKKETWKITVNVTLCSPEWFKR